MNRIKPKDIKPLRQQLLIEQGGLCALCQELIAEGEAVLDHCHRTGQIRAVLHRGCNAYIGSLENNQKRNQITTRRLAKILAGFTAYVQALKPILHSTYRTAEERAERAKKRAQKNRQKKQAKSRDTTKN